MISMLPNVVIKPMFFIKKKTQFVFILSKRYSSLEKKNNLNSSTEAKDSGSYESFIEKLLKKVENERRANSNTTTNESDANNSPNKTVISNNHNNNSNNIDNIDNTKLDNKPNDVEVVNDLNDIDLGHDLDDIDLGHDNDDIRVNNTLPTNNSIEKTTSQQELVSSTTLRNTTSSSNDENVFSSEYNRIQNNLTNLKDSFINNKQELVSLEKELEETKKITTKIKDALSDAGKTSLEQGTNLTSEQVTVKSEATAKILLDKLMTYLTSSSA